MAERSSREEERMKRRRVPLFRMTWETPTAQQRAKKPPEKIQKKDSRELPDELSELTRPEMRA
jgi:hypothetical protein